MASSVRMLSAGATGVGTALVGTALPLIAITAGILVEALIPERVHGTTENIVDGVVDGSAAVLGYALVTGSRTAPLARPEALLDDNALVG